MTGLRHRHLHPRPAPNQVLSTQAPRAARPHHHGSRIIRTDGALLKCLTGGSRCSAAANSSDLLGHQAMDQTGTPVTINLTDALLLIFVRAASGRSSTAPSSGARASKTGSHTCTGGASVGEPSRCVMGCSRGTTRAGSLCNALRCCSRSCRRLRRGVGNSPQSPATSCRIRRAGAGRGNRSERRSPQTCCFQP